MAVVDWRQHNVLPDVVNQGNCDCCWAIVACNAISSAQTIRFQNPRTVYSYQQLIDCCEEKKWSTLKPEEKHKCQKSSYKIAFQYIMTAGLSFDKDHEFVKKRNPCTQRGHRFNMISNYVDLHNDRNAVLEVIQQQPVAARIHVTRSFTEFNGQGIYIRPADEPIEIDKKHAVLIVGCGEDDGVQYFLIQNSWGLGWGDGGYAKVGREFLSRFCYPVVNDMREEMGECLFKKYFPEAV